MSNIEHMFENAIFAMEERVKKEDWIANEYLLGNASESTAKEMDIIWTCAEMVLFHFFDNADDFETAINTDFEELRKREELNHYV